MRQMPPEDVVVEARKLGGMRDVEVEGRGRLPGLGWCAGGWFEGGLLLDQHLGESGWRLLGRDEDSSRDLWDQAEISWHLQKRCWWVLSRRERGRCVVNFCFFKERNKTQDRIIEFKCDYVLVPYYPIGGWHLPPVGQGVFIEGKYEVPRV